MKKTALILLSLCLCSLAFLSLAEDALSVQPSASTPVFVPTAEHEPVADAFLQEYPDAQIDLILTQRDDGKTFRQIFFLRGEELGECLMEAQSLTIRRVRFYDLSKDS